MPTAIEQVHSREWFYAYELPDGSTAPTYHGFDIQPIHDTRWRMLDACLEERLGDGRGALSALDLACHQGWFAVNMAKSGFGRVLGIDARDSHVNDSRLIANSISSFAAGGGDNTFHSIFGAHNASIFTVTEVMTNSGVVSSRSRSMGSWHEAINRPMLMIIRIFRMESFIVLEF